jgi:ribosomal protein S18 acetylase RimI-like enzyme
VSAAIVPYAESHFDGVKNLWLESFPGDPSWNRAEAAIPAKLAVQRELFLVALDGNKIVGSIMAGYDGHRGWLYAVAVSNDFRRRGIGSALVHEAETRLKALGCRKINLQIRASNAAVGAFYKRLGYGTEDRISMGKRIIAS